MSQHPEIIAAPFTIWVAPVGTAFPAIDAQPSAPWILVGTNGDRSLSDAGVTVQISREVEVSVPAGRSTPTSVFYPRQELRIRAELLDLTLEQFSRAIGLAPVSITTRLPYQAGFREIGLTVPERANAAIALLVRGRSPYGEDFAAQFEVPRCRHGGNPLQINPRRGRPAGIAAEFIAIEDPAATSEATLFGRLVAQDATAIIPITTEEDIPLLTSTNDYLEI